MPSLVPACRDQPPGSWRAGAAGRLRRPRRPACVPCRTSRAAVPRPPCCGSQVAAPPAAASCPTLPCPGAAGGAAHHWRPRHRRDAGRAGPPGRRPGRLPALPPGARAAPGRPRHRRQVRPRRRAAPLWRAPAPAPAPSAGPQRFGAPARNQAPGSAATSRARLAMAAVAYERACALVHEGVVQT